LSALAARGGGEGRGQSVTRGIDLIESIPKARRVAWGRPMGQASSRAPRCAAAQHICKRLTYPICTWERQGELQKKKKEEIRKWKKMKRFLHGINNAES